VWMRGKYLRIEGGEKINFVDYTMLTRRKSMNTGRESGAKNEKKKMRMGNG
jgi:hypothetical protein